MTQPSLHPWNRALWESLPTPEQLRPVLLLSGPDGTGKTAFAMALAHRLLCAQPASDGQACGVCHACRLLAAGNHPDLRVLGSADEAEEEEGGGEETSAQGKSSRWIKVGSVRMLADFLAFSAHLGGRKVVVIEKAERLNPSAASALLKTLEEPPPQTHFLLVAGKPARLPATVRSRCVTLPFALPPLDAGLAWLRAQGAQRPELALAQAGGAPLTALMLDSTGYWSARDSLLDAVLTREDFDPVAVVDRLGPEQLPAMVQSLQRWTYDLLALASHGTVRYNPDCAQILHRLAARTSRLCLLRFSRQLHEVVRSLEHPLNARLVAQRCLFAYRAALGGTEG
ncbi:MAG: DNA polymerase III subunit delta' [Burkholderiales bacterium]|nr:DNA polymerase III subunit delta' [Burkholderiales bacterium]